MPLLKYIVRLTDEERTDLENLIHTGKHRAAATLIHARILLKADVGTGGPGWDDDRMVEAIECSASTVYRVRQAFVEVGMTAALFRKKPTGRLYRKLDGEQEAQRIALACSTPPAGRTHWMMRLLADRLVELQVVESISPECVRTTLKKLGWQTRLDQAFFQGLQISVWILPKPPAQHPGPAALFPASAHHPPLIEVGGRYTEHGHELRF